MNVIDLVILGAVGLLALLGLKTGLLKPAAGVGGLTLGVFLATQHTGAVAPLLEEQLADEPIRRVTSFIAIVVLVAIAIRVSAHYVKRLMTALVIGWLDHLAGAVAGAVVALVVAGTAMYLLAGFGPARGAVADSRLAPEITKVSLLTTVTPWCSSLEAAAKDQETCTDLGGVFDQILGRHISDGVDLIIGEDGGTLAGLVGGAVTGSQLEVREFVEAKVAETAEARLEPDGVR